VEGRRGCSKACTTRLFSFVPTYMEATMRKEPFMDLFYALAIVAPVIVLVVVALAR
jgi:hypothetical protein